MKVKLGDICAILNGYAFKSEEYVTTGIRIIRIANVQKGYIEDSLPCFYPLEQKSILCRYMLEEGDLLISLTGNVGRVALLHKDMLPAALNQRVACIRLKSSDVIKKYLFYFMNSDKFEQDCVDSSKGVAQKNMSTDWLKEYVLDIPTLETQEKVICILDKICALIEKRKQQLENLDLLVKSQFIALFGHGQFEQVPISFFVEDKIESAKRKFSGEDVIRYIDISSIDNKMNVMTGFTEYKFKDAPSRAQQCLKCGDVVISTVRPNLKNIAMNNFSYNNLVGSSGFCVLRAKKSSPQYLFGAVLIDEFSRKMSELATGANYPAIKDSDVLAYKIPNAPVALQSQFDSVVEQTGKSKITIKRSLEKLETLKKALMQKYFG